MIPFAYTIIAIQGTLQGILLTLCWTHTRIINRRLNICEEALKEIIDKTSQSAREIQEMKKK